MSNNKSYKRGINDTLDSDRRPKRARVTTVQFGLLSSDEIERLSATKVSDVVINKSGIVHKNGVNDSAMGTISRSMLCSTCSGEMQSCPGHTGHIELVTPVINIEFIGHIHKILTCVCFWCSRLLLPKDHSKYDSIMRVKSMKKRQSAIYAICQKIRTCTSFKNSKKKMGTKYPEPVDTLSIDLIDCENGCGGSQPQYIKDDIFIRAIFTLNDSELASIKHSEFDAPVFTPEKMFQILRYISPEDIISLGMDPENAHPSSMMWKNLIVPPIPMRPSRSKANVTKIGGEDDLTIRLRGIVKANNQYRDVLGEGVINMARYNHNSIIYKDVQDMIMNTQSDLTCIKNDKSAWSLYADLHRLVAGYQDSKYQNKATDGSEYGRDKKCVRHRFAGQKAKKGRMRHTIFGKRQNYSSRTVITPCSNMDIDEVGVPMWICMKLTYPERVTSFNIHMLTNAVRNGPKVHPGANYVVDDLGKVTSLKFVDRYSIQLKHGWIVRRHLKDGDDVLFNRQPSLHKMSLMAHRVKVMDGHSFRLHMAVTKPYNADFDGDEMNLQVVMDELTRAEARGLLSVRHNMVKDTVPLVCFQQNTVAAAYLLSRPNEKIIREDALQLLYQNKYLDIERIPAPTFINEKGEEFFSGLSVLSACFPPEMYLHYKDVVIERGLMTAGRLNADTLNKGVLYTIWKDFGEDTACDFISGMQLLLEHYLNSQGLTIGVDDCYMEIPESLKVKVKVAMDYVERFPSHNPIHTGKSSETIENNICLVLDKARDVVGDYVLDRLKSGPERANGLYEMIKSGAKGNDTNIIQISGLVGQQRNHHSMRMSSVTSHFRDGANKGSAHGMVYRSFFRGLRPFEYFNHLVGSRVGLVDTAVKTSETGIFFCRIVLYVLILYVLYVLTMKFCIGYSQRRIAKAMEDLVVHLDKSVRNSNNDIVQYVYGDDGFDSASVEWNVIRILSMTEEDVLVNYRCMPSINKSHMDNATRTRWESDISTYSHLWKTEVNRLLQLRNEIVKVMMETEFNDKCLCPVPFERLLKRAVFEKSHEYNTDLTPKDVSVIVNLFWNDMLKQTVLIPTLKVEALFWDWCSTRSLWKTYSLDRKALQWFLSKVHYIFMAQSVTPYESVGMAASQHCAEPLTQLTLNRFHKSGQFSHLVSGVARMKEIINAVKNPKTPCMTIVVKDGYDLEKIGNDFTEVLACQVIESWGTDIPVDGEKRYQSFIKSWKRWDDNQPHKCLVIYMNKESAVRLTVTPRILCNALRRCDWRKKMNDFDSLFSYSDLTDDVWWVSLSLSADDIVWQYSYNAIVKHTVGKTPEDEMVLMHIYEKTVKDCLVKGIRGLEDFYVSTKAFTEVVDGIPKRVVKNVILTKGSNLVDLLNRKEVVSRRAMTNHIREVEQTLGIDAARASIEEEWRTVMTINNAHVGTRHIKLIAEMMCHRGFVCPMTYQGICRETSSVIKKASFEKAMDSFIWGATQAHTDVLNGCMDAICWNGILKAGTGKVELYTEPYEIPKHIQTKNDLHHARKMVEYTPPSLNEMSKYLIPKTKRRLTLKKSVDMQNRISVSFTPSSTCFFTPYSPRIETKSSVSVTFTSDENCIFKPWSL